MSHEEADQAFADETFISATATEQHQGQRLDKVLVELCPDYSRSRLQALIVAGDVAVNGAFCMNAAQKVAAGDVFEITIPAPSVASPEPENIPLDILYEDEALIVLNKPVGLVVHPGAGNWSGTLVNALLHHCAGQLSGIGGVARPGIVHRLDKDTSGLMVVAKTDAAHQGLAAQLEDRSLSRVYEALVLKVPTPLKGVIDRPIGRDPRNRLKMTIMGRGSREARTHYRVLERFGEALALVECILESGRTHQIRVHMASIKHPLVGDQLYGPQITALESVLKKAEYSPEMVDFVKNFPRQALHAKAIKFIHPLTEEAMNFEIPLPDDLSKLLISLNK